MLPTFVIGLRECLEGFLIVAMVAAFLVKSGRRAALKYVWLGVAGAALICVAAGVILKVVSADLPQKQQEGVETVVGAIAVAMVTYMVVWMRRHARDLKGELEQAASAALMRGSAWALVAMAALAVLREGLETVVFLIAAFDASDSPAAAGTGGLLGILTAVVLGFAIFRGGLRVNLGRFFRITGVVLVFVAGGLVVSALHTAHGAGWLNVGQGETWDLSWLVDPGSIRSSLLTGMLGLQPRPVVIEVIGWLAYVIPVTAYVAWPPSRRVRPTVVRAALAGTAVLAVAGAAVSAAVAPSAPPAGGLPVVSAWEGSATLTDPVSRVKQAPAQISGPTLAQLSGASAPVSVPALPSTVELGKSVSKGEHTIGGTTATYERSELREGMQTYVLQTTDRAVATDIGTLPAGLTIDQLLEQGGRLPIGLSAAQAGAVLPITYTDEITRTYWVQPSTGAILDVTTHLQRTADVKSGAATVTLAVVAEVTAQPSAQARASIAADARETLDRQHAHDRYARTLPLGLLAVAALAVLALIVQHVRTRRPTMRMPAVNARPVDVAR